MLQLLRGKKSSLFVKIVLGVIVIGFSFFGIESYFVANTSTNVATVGDGAISEQEFTQRYNRAVQFEMQRMKQQFGANVNASMFQTPAYKHRVLEDLVNEKLLLEANDRLGIVVPLERLRSEIQKVAAFQNEGVFDPEQYKQVLAANGMSPQSFEEEMRKEIGRGLLPTQIAATSIATDAEVDAYLRLRDQSRDFRFAKLDKPAPAEGEIKDDEIDAWYKQHQAEFMIPEQVAVEYLELDASKLEIDQTPDEGVLKDRYEKSKARYVTPEQRLASHILIKVGGKGSPDDQKAALAKAEDIERQLKGGKDFATLAKQESADLGSKNQGGDLGWLDRGTTDEAFENALFALAKGEVSKPVLTGEGYHVIELRDVRPGKTRSFDEVKPDLVKEYADTERERVYSDKAGRLTELTYQNPSTLETAAKELGLTVQKTDLFARTGGQGIAANPAFAQAAFGDSVLVQNNNSDPVEIGPNHIAVMRIAEHKPATPKPLAEVSEAVRKRIVSERTAKQAKDHADALFAELGKDKTLDALATSENLKVEEQKGVGRDAANLDSRLVSAVFSMPRPAGDQPSYRLVDLGGDSYALVQLTGVTDGDPSKLDAKTREAARNTLQQQSSSAVTREFVDAIRKATKVSISESKLQDQNP
ncbi:MAG: SurA N-terminal domain-containing protein [Dokdonella sp.]|uniref:SurA N-terminal domain-containing protein n=1 Tax=Dokdonella sp. TaxID=2291710 RepID=UPI003F7CF91D